MNGASLEDYYKKIPDNLKGMIELVYDLNNHPSIRLIEPLIYKNYYDEKAQSLALSFSNEDSRPFVMSTPRLENENEVQLRLPFSDNRWDLLFKMHYETRDSNYISELFEIPPHKEALFSSFFTDNPPPLKPDRKYQGNGIRVRYFGHACVLLETDKISILIDPVISYEACNGDKRYTYNDLPDVIDYVLLTHNHQDHVLFETLLQLRHKISNIIFPGNLSGSLFDPSLRLILKHLGFNNLITIHELDEVKISDGSITSIPFLGEHSYLNIQTKTAYYVNLKGKKFLFAADSNNLESKLYEHIFSFTGTIDTVFIGMECEGAPLSWLYGPLLTNPLKRNYDASRTLSGSNFEKAWDIVRQSGCKQAYIYAMGQEPWLNYIMTLSYSSDSPQIIESDHLIQMCHKHGIDSERLYIHKEWIF
jgi:L-ascorbate metabolism protein UlaG (beta-lactamase superfamily)